MGKRDNRRTRKMNRRKGQVKKKARLARKIKSGATAGVKKTTTAAPKTAASATVKRTPAAAASKAAAPAKK